MWKIKNIGKKLLDIIYENEDINLHIYGPNFRIFISKII